VAALWRSFLVAAAITTASATLAKTTGVGDDPALQQGPCYQALVDRNVAQPTTAPNRELGAACAAENGDIEKAWARVIRLWGSDSTDIPDYDSYRPADEGSSSSVVWLGFALLATAVAFAVLGTPIRPMAAFLSGEARSGASAAATALDLLGRLVIGLLVLAASALPGGGVVLAVVVIGLVALRARRGFRTQRGENVSANETGPTAIAAEVINDVLGVFPTLLAIGVLAQHDSRILFAAILLSLLASIPAVILARRKLQASSLALLIGAAALAGICGIFALRNPLLSGVIPNNPTVYLAVAFLAAGAVVASGRTSARRRLSSTPTA
jgi:hypothetical protein